jgi:hypothetical protein
MVAIGAGVSAPTAAVTAICSRAFMAHSARRFAITYTVKNEANLLPDAIDYHLKLGCSRIYVFFDGTTDDTRERIRDKAGIVCADSIDPRSLGDVPEWIAQLLPRWRESMDVRKRINSFAAAQIAKQEEIEWLISVDPDELLLMNDGAADEPGNCEDFFRTVPAEVDQILVPNMEAVPVGEGSGKPFVDCTLFLRRFPATEFLWRVSAGIVRRSVSNPKIHAWYDYWFYRARFGGALPRLMRHPATGESIPAGYFLGYSNHKAFIRTGVAGEFLFNIHKWQRVRRHPRSIKKGSLLHYDLCSAEYFCSKFRQRQTGMLVKAFHCRYVFAQIARDLPFVVGRQFFLDHICISDPNILQRLRQRGVLTEILFISRLMQRRAAPY